MHVPTVWRARAGTPFRRCRECSVKVVTRAVEYGDPAALARRVVDAARVGATSLDAVADLAASVLIMPAGHGPLNLNEAVTSGSAGAPADGGDDDDRDGAADDDDGVGDDDEDSPLAILLRARQASGAQ